MSKRPQPPDHLKQSRKDVLEALAKLFDHEDEQDERTERLIDELYKKVRVNGGGSSGGGRNG
jgi:hypothetical protein